MLLILLTERNSTTIPTIQTSSRPITRSLSSIPSLVPLHLLRNHERGYSHSRCPSQQVAKRAKGVAEHGQKETCALEQELIRRSIGKEHEGTPSPTHPGQRDQPIGPAVHLLTEEDILLGKIETENTGKRGGIADVL